MRFREFLWAIVATVTLLLACIVAPITYLYQAHVCEDVKGGHWKPTSGFNALCISDDGRIIP